MKDTLHQLVQAISSSAWDKNLTVNDNANDQATQFFYFHTCLEALTALYHSLLIVEKNTPTETRLESWKKALYARLERINTQSRMVEPQLVLLLKQNDASFLTKLLTVKGNEDPRWKQVFSFNIPFWQWAQFANGTQKDFSYHYDMQEQDEIYRQQAFSLNLSNRSLKEAASLLLTLYPLKEKKEYAEMATILGWLLIKAYEMNYLLPDLRWAFQKVLPDPGTFLTEFEWEQEDHVQKLLKVARVYLGLEIPCVVFDKTL